jgi:hypothetical protein
VQIGLFTGCLGGIRGYQGVSRVIFVSETAQVELKSGRVQAPAWSECTASVSVAPNLAIPCTNSEVFSSVFLPYLQGLTLVDFPAQHSPFLTQNTP